jgi:competence protein ComEA
MSEGAFRTAGMVVSVVLVAAIVLAAAVLLLRNGGDVPIQILPPGQGSEAANPVTAANGDVRIYITGAVRNPGVFPMIPGDRLSDAVAAAGGPTNEAQLALVNLALRVVDQGHYHIPALGETPPPQTGISSSASGTQTTQVDSHGLIGAPVEAQNSTGGLVDLNLALPSVLETLPGIGPVMAQAIVDHRDKNGPFRSVDEITDVPRIGPATYQKIRDLVTVGGPP